MSFTPLLTDQPISYAFNRPACFRNSLREEEVYGGSVVGSPVYFNPSDLALGLTGYPGPRYQQHKNYNTSTSNINGNCTWWCWGRLKDAIGTNLRHYGHAVDWYQEYQNDGGSVSPNAYNAQPGDIICFSSSEPEGHVMFIEKIENNTIYISQSAYSPRALWNGYACRVTSYNVADIFAGHSINMYKDISSSPFSVTTIGVLHTGEAGGNLDPLTISIVADIIIKKGGNFNVKL